MIWVYFAFCVLRPCSHAGSFYSFFMKQHRKKIYDFLASKGVKTFEFQDELSALLKEFAQAAISDFCVRKDPTIHQLYDAEGELEVEE